MLWPYADGRLSSASGSGPRRLRAVGMSEDVCAKTLVITLSTPFLRFDQQRADLLLNASGDEQNSTSGSSRP